MADLCVPGPSLVEEVDCRGAVYFQPPCGRSNPSGRVQSMGLWAGPWDSHGTHIILQLHTGDSGLSRVAAAVVEELSRSVAGSTQSSDDTTAVLFVPKTHIEDGVASTVDTYELLRQAAHRVAAAAEGLEYCGVAATVGR